MVTPPFSNKIKYHIHGLLYYAISCRCFAKKNQNNRTANNYSDMQILCQMKNIDFLVKIHACSP